MKRTRERRGLHSNVDPTNHEVLFIYLFFLETKKIKSKTLKMLFPLNQ